MKNVINKGCFKRAILFDIEYLNKIKNTSKYPALQHVNEAPFRYFNDLFIHLKSMDDGNISVINKKFQHKIFYTAGNSYNQFNLSLKDQLLGLVFSNEKKYNIFYDEIVYVDKNLEEIILHRPTNETKTISKFPKVAVIIGGQPRLAEKSIPILLEWLDGTDYKIYSHAWNKLGGVTKENTPSTRNIDVEGNKLLEVQDETKTFLQATLKQHYLKFGDSIKDPKIPLHQELYSWKEEKKFSNLIKHGEPWGAQGFPAWLSWWNSYNFALDIDNLHNAEIVIRTRWDNFCNLDFKLINFIKDKLNFQIAENTVYVSNIDHVYTEEPRNYIFYENFHSENSLVKDHFWFGSYKTQIKLLTQWIDLVSSSMLENNLMFSNRKIPWPEYFLLSNIIKLGFKMEINKLPIVLGKPGCKDYNNFKEVEQNSNFYYSNSIENSN